MKSIMFRRQYLILLYILGAFALPALAAGESVCQAEMSYKWRKKEAKEDSTQFWLLVERKGSDEAAARAALDREIARERARAAAECKRVHENAAGCIAAKFSAQASLLAALDFSARRELEKAITEDCSAAQGVCAGTHEGEVKCHQLADAAATPGAEGEGKKDDDKKDAKKKKGH